VLTNKNINPKKSKVMIAQMLIQEIKDLYVSINQEEPTELEIVKLENSTEEELTDLRNGLKMSSIEEYPNFDNLY
jgi:uncharacterized protein YbcI